MRGCIENATAAVLSEIETQPPSAPQSAAERLFEQAQRVIESQYYDPAFTVARLRADLAVSSNILHAAFAARGTTPLTEIRRERLRAADRHFAILLAPTSEDREMAARRSGFHSLRALRSARKALSS